MKSIFFRKYGAPKVRSAFEYFELPYLKVVRREELIALLDDRNAVRKHGAARILQKLIAGEVSAVVLLPGACLEVGRRDAVIGMSAETIVDYAQHFNKEFGPGTWVCGYADDSISYHFSAPCLRVRRL